MPAAVAYTRVVLGGQLVRAGLAAISLPIAGSRESLVTGTYQPTLATTGLNVPESSLTVANGGANVSYNDDTVQVIENMRFQGYVYVGGKNKTFRNCLFEGPATIPSSAGVPIVNCNTQSTSQNIVFEDCEWRPRTNDRRTNSILGHDYTLRRCLIQNTVDGLGITSPGNVSVLGCVIRKLLYFSPSDTHSDNQTHSDLCQIHGGTNILLDGSVLEAMSESFDALRVATYDGNGDKIGGNSFWSPGMTSAPTLSCIMINGSGGSGGIVVRRSWLAGGGVVVNALDPTALNSGSFSLEDSWVDVSTIGFGPTQILVTTSGKNAAAVRNKVWNRSDPFSVAGADANNRINQ